MCACVCCVLKRRSFYRCRCKRRVAPNCVTFKNNHYSYSIVFRVYPLRVTDTQLEAAGGDRKVLERIALRLVVGAGPNARTSIFI